MEGNWGETQKIKYIFKAKKSGGKLKNKFLGQTKVHGKCRETQKINFKVYKSAGKLGGKNQIHFKAKKSGGKLGGNSKKSISRPRKKQGNWRETQKCVLKA